MNILHTLLKITDTPYKKTFLHTLFDVPGNNFISEPIDEYYYVLGEVLNFAWYNIKPNLLSNRILNDINNNKATLILSGHVEAINTRHVVSSIHAIADFYKIDPHKIIYIDSNYKLSKALQKSKLTGFFNNIHESTVDHVVNIPTDIRQKKFLLLSGKAREHRLRLVDTLSKIDNFLNTSIVSTQSGKYLDILTNKYIKVDERVLDINYGYKDALSDEQVVPIKEDFYSSTYISIVPMTFFKYEHNHLQLDEKVYKPVCAMHPFIVFGEYRTLKALHELEYQTFDNWIDESYDNELDDEKRFNLIVDEIKRLNNLTITELHNMYIEMTSILTHNYNLNKKRKLNCFNGLDLTNKIISATIT